MTWESWIVSAAIPTIFLLFYWIVIEPRQNRERARGRRFRKALEKAIARDYKLEPGHSISAQGLMFEGASDAYRKSRYQDLEVTDLFVPDPRKGHLILAAKANEGAAMFARAQVERADSFSPELLETLSEWEQQVANDVLFYQRGPLRKGQAAGFTKHSFTKQPTYALQLKRLEHEVRELRLYAVDQVNLAREQAERGDDF
jgi:hypothetical protein